MLLVSCLNSPGHESIRRGTAQLKWRIFFLQKSPFWQLGPGLRDPGPPCSPRAFFVWEVTYTKNIWENAHYSSSREAYTLLPRW